VTTDGLNCRCLGEGVDIKRQPYVPAMEATRDTAPICLAHQSTGSPKESRR
jgi:hypothetical protein